MDGMSRKITWTRTVVVPFNAEVTTNQARSGALMAMGSMLCVQIGLAIAVTLIDRIGVEVAHGKGAHRLVWPGLAAVGVVLLTQPFGGGVDPIGVLLALGAAVFWAGYILLTQRAGDEVAGINALAVSMPVAGLVATIAVGPAVLPRITPEILLIGVGLAILLPVVPFALELLALRRLTTA